VGDYKNMGHPGERGIKPPVEVLPANKQSVFKEVARKVGAPAYVYFQGDLESGLQRFLNIPAPNGLIVRYAMKANPNSEILRLFDKMGAHIDASTFNEARRAIKKGHIKGEKVRLTSQEVQTPDKLKYLAKNGVKYTACSLRQLDTYGEALPGTEVGIRFNIGIGSGWNKQTSTGGKNSPFGIYEHREEIDTLLDKHKLKLTTVHVHIGSGSDPAKQKEAIKEALNIVKDYESVTTLNMGGGFKVGRMSGEQDTDIEEMGQAMGAALADFEQETGRKIRLEVEPGTALVANAGHIVTEIIDIKDTGPDGRKFLIVNGGMNMNARPVFYGAQHPLVVVAQDGIERDVSEYAVFGINCESGDLLTPEPGKPETIAPRRLLEAKIGDLLVIGGAGAYCSSMAPGNYNSQPLQPEVMIEKDGNIRSIRKRQPLRDLWRRERPRFSLVA
jgi:diaminopimelate decarboxylase